jgi:putative spermidine/putrescine transport system ATP-binding protein
VVQAGPPAEVYARPASRFAAEFLGLQNIFAGRVARRDGRWVAETPAGALPVAAAAGGEQAWTEGQPVTVVVRPEGVRVAPNGVKADLAGPISEKSFRGSRNVVVLRVGEAELTVTVPAGEALPMVGEALSLTLEPEAVQVLPEDGDG